MIKLLIKRFIPSAENSSDPVLRQQYCMLSGILGMVCNLVLFAIKLSAGLIMGSIAVPSDAANVWMNEMELVRLFDVIAPTQPLARQGAPLRARSN